LNDARLQVANLQRGAVIRYRDLARTPQQFAQGKLLPDTPTGFQRFREVPNQLGDVFRAYRRAVGFG
jgi:hypothetical protein